MDNLLYVAMSHQSAMQRRMDVVSNNIANMNTTGFRGERVTFRHHLEELEGDGPKGMTNVNFTLDYGILRNLEQGSFMPTNNPLDVALEGSGFLTIENDLGETLYTRSGHLRINAESELILASGQRVLDENGNPITIDPEDTNIKITKDGRIFSDLGEIARLGLAAFNDEQNMERLGAAIYRTDEPPKDPQDLNVLQGSLEGSNVNSISEITEMINVMRSYQSVQRQMDSVQELRDRSIDRLARVG